MKALSQLLRGTVVLLLRIYRGLISPLKPPCCRFMPSCSQYGLTAFRRFGFWRALGLTVWRILRCHPFYRGTLHDPVPGRRDKVTGDKTEHPTTKRLKKYSWID